LISAVSSQETRFDSPELLYYNEHIVMLYSRGISVIITNQIKKDFHAEGDKVIRKAENHDYPFLREMLYEAIYVHEGEEKPPFSVLDTPELKRYTQGWKKGTDAGYIAEIGGRPAGAAWVRLFKNVQTGGYGFVDSQTPELCLAVKKQYRGAGVGTAMLQSLLEELKELGFRKMSLSVDRENQAVSLYKRFGFTIIEERKIDFLMVKKL